VSGAGLIVAAPASDSGKTLVTAGLLRCLSRQGLRAAAAKAGPDFIDPTFHAVASGMPRRSLDVWAMRPAALAATVGGLESDGEIVLCEGAWASSTEPDPMAKRVQPPNCARHWLAGCCARRRCTRAVRFGGRAAAGFRRSPAGCGASWGCLQPGLGRASQAAARRLGDAALTWHQAARLIAGGFGTGAAGTPPRPRAGAEKTMPQRQSSSAAAAIGAALDIDGLAELARLSRLCGGKGAPGVPPFGRHVAVARDDAFCFFYPAVLPGGRRPAPPSPSFPRSPEKGPRRKRIRSICRAAIPSYGPAG
jgi:cobyrinic acid a,c-diamide synthase